MEPALVMGRNKLKPTTQERKYEDSYEDYLNGVGAETPINHKFRKEASLD